MDNIMLYALSKVIGNAGAQTGKEKAEPVTAVVLTREEFLALASWDSSTLYVVTYTDPEGTERVELFVGDQIIDVFAA